MNFKKDKNYIKLIISLLVAAFLIIIFYRWSYSINLTSIISKAKSILSPFMYAIGIALVLNPSIKFIENKILLKSNYIKERHSLKRVISISAVYIFVFVFSFWTISYIIPETKESIQNLKVKITSFDISYLEESIDKYIHFNSEVGQKAIEKMNMFLSQIINNIPNTLSKLLSSTVELASLFLNIILGMVMSIYILFDKESIAVQSKKIVYALASKSASDKIIRFFRNSNYTFEKFFVGKIIDSAIIAILFFIGINIISPKFTVLLSLIIGVTNMIPFFGPFIGGIPVVLITLISDITNPLKALWVAVFILALQQFDGNILGPKILGNSIGVKPLGIIFSIIVAGAIFGPAGMFFGVPVFAVIFSFFDEFLDKKYEEKYKE